MNRIIAILTVTSVLCFSSIVAAQAEFTNSLTEYSRHEVSAAVGDNGMPSPDDYAGLSKKVLQYSHAFSQVVSHLKEPAVADKSWASLEALVDVDQFERRGVFLTDRAEVIDWARYKHYITQYGAATSWRGVLRQMTEVPGRVILELEEHNTVDGVTDIANTVTIYEFNAAGKLVHLDVYVMPLPVPE